VRVSQGGAAVTLSAVRDDRLAADTVRVSTGLAATAALGAAFGPVTVETA